MGTSQNWLRAKRHIDATRLADAVFAARRLLSSIDLDRGDAHAAARVQMRARIPEHWPKLPNPQWPDKAAFQRLMQAAEDDPHHPRNWHRRLVNEALQRPDVRDAYFAIRCALWKWDEFAGVRPGARAILESVIELAREEALPWYLAVPAEDVRRLARLSEGRYASSVRELECLAITRPARIMRIAHPDGFPMFPGQCDESQPLQPVAQWVIRYRRGVPWNAKRAAWWINYDLLCETGRVMPHFVMRLRTLSSTYQSRNRRMGPPPGDWVMSNDEDAFRAMEEVLSRHGPPPPIGLRAPLWCDVCAGRSRR